MLHTWLSSMPHSVTMRPHCSPELTSKIDKVTIKAAVFPSLPHAEAEIVYLKCLCYIKTLRKLHFLKNIIYLFMYLFLAMLGLHCCVHVSLVVASKATLAVHRLLISVRFLLWSTGSTEHGLQWLQFPGS